LSPEDMAAEAPCHSGPRENWCDRRGPAGFMGHTCTKPVWRVLNAITAEISKSERDHGPGFHSDHEAYAVLLEELDEVWDWVKMRKADRDREKMVKELVQVAAVATRWATQLLEKGKS